MKVLFDQRRLPRTVTRAQWQDIWHRYRALCRKYRIWELDLLGQIMEYRDLEPRLAAQLTQRLVNPPIVVFCDPLMIEDRTPLRIHV